MRLPIIKSFILSGLFVLLLFGLSQKVEAQLTPDSALSSPDMKGRVISNTNAGISGVWVRWEDNLQNVRFTQTRSDGSYLFESWQNLGDQGRLDQYHTMIDTNLDGSVDSRMANITQNSGFGCVENPHTITVVKPYNWAGSFSTATFGDISNDPLKLQFPDITYTPGANSASCISMDAPSQVIAGQTFSATVRMKNNTIPSQWTAQNNYRLGRWDNPNNGWIFPDGNQDRVYLSSPVNGGDTYTFSNFNVTAPNTPGTKNLETRMVQDGREWFGEICSKPIIINAVTSLGPALGPLQIIPDSASGGVAQGTYGISGLRSDQSGSNYYNALLISQKVTNGDTSNTALVGTAFTSKASPPANNSLAELVRSANADKGFVLLYANQNKTTAGYSFTAGNYYVYFKGGWNGPFTTDPRNSEYKTSPEILVTIKGGGPFAAQFSVTMNRSLGSHTWGTYGYLMDSSGNETKEIKTPTNQ